MTGQVNSNNPVGFGQFFNHSIPIFARPRKIVAEQFWYFRKLYGDPSFTPDILSTVTARTLIVHGDRDPIAPLENALIMHKYIPGSHLYVLPGANHHSFFFPEYGDQFINTVARFMRSGFGPQ